jgi:predicted phage tail protein
MTDVEYITDLNRRRRIDRELARRTHRRRSVLQLAHTAFVALTGCALTVAAIAFSASAPETGMALLGCALILAGIAVILAE